MIRVAAPTLGACLAASCAGECWQGEHVDQRSAQLVQLVPAAGLRIVTDPPPSPRGAPIALAQHGDLPC